MALDGIAPLSTLGGNERTAEQFQDIIGLRCSKPKHVLECSWFWHDHPAENFSRARRCRIAVGKCSFLCLWALFYTWEPWHQQARMGVALCSKVTTFAISNQTDVWPSINQVCQGLSCKDCVLPIRCWIFNILNRPFDHRFHFERYWRRHHWATDSSRWSYSAHSRHLGWTLDAGRQYFFVAKQLMKDVWSTHKWQRTPQVCSQKGIYNLQRPRSLSSFGPFLMNYRRLDEIICTWILQCKSMLNACLFNCLLKWC